MITLLYLSQSRRDITNAQVSDILTTSKVNNLTYGITGVLIHGGGLFMQVLEGPEQSTLRLYGKIAEDRRHGDCKLIHISLANEQIFKKWSMAVIKCDPLQFQHIAELREKRYESVPAKDFTSLMGEFVKLLNAGQPQSNTSSSGKALN